MLYTVVILIVMVQIIQMIGDSLYKELKNNARKTKDIFCRKKVLALSI